MKTHCFIALLLLAIGTFARAQDAVPADGSAPAAESPPEGGTTTIDAPPPEEPPAAEEDGPAIPIAYDVSRYDSIWDKNPFTRKVVVVAQAAPDWTQDWALAGMFSHKGKIRISIRNKQTNEFKRITNEPKDGDEFKLVEAHFNRSRKEASAELEKDGKKGTVKYDENAAPVTINNIARPAGGGAGQPGPAGMQAQPGRPGGQPIITKPLAPQPNGRVFNAPNLPGGVSGGQAGMAPGMGGNPGVVTPMNNGQIVQPGVTPNLPGNVPTISRRRQLIPAPVVAPQGNP